MMTRTEAIARVRSVGYTLRRVDGEWQVKPAGTLWDGPRTYYTNDLEDAVNTAIFEYMQDHPVIPVVGERMPTLDTFRRVRGE